jgi:hypothetical protein
MFPAAAQAIILEVWEKAVMSAGVAISIEFIVADSFGFSR